MLSSLHIISKFLLVALFGFINTSSSAVLPFAKSSFSLFNSTSVTVIGATTTSNTVSLPSYCTFIICFPTLFLSYPSIVTRFDCKLIVVPYP